MAKTCSWEFTISRPITDKNMDDFLDEFHAGLFPKFWNLFSISRLKAYCFLSSHVREEHLSVPGRYRLMITTKFPKTLCTLSRKI